MADDRGTPPQAPPMRDLLAACRAARALSTPPAAPPPGPDRTAPEPAPEPGDARDAA
jgi:hypothetical protein